MDEVIKCGFADSFEVWGWDDDSEANDKADVVEEDSEVEREPSIYERPEYLKARSRLLYLWGLAQETDHYCKKDWIHLDGRLGLGDDPEEVLRNAELKYELCQDLSWPSQFE